MRVSGKKLFKELNATVNQLVRKGRKSQTKRNKASLGGLSTKEEHVLETYHI